MPRTIFSQKKLCLEVANAAVTNIIQKYAHVWVQLKLFPTH